MRNRQVLIVSPYFPPSTVAGVHRARIMTMHLMEYGWQSTVLCVHEREHEQNLDVELTQLVSSDVDVIKVGAWNKRVSRLFGLGDVSIRGYRALKREVISRIQSGQVDLLFITVLPGFPLRMVADIKQRFGIPVVIDYQDPMLPDLQSKPPLFSKARAAYQLAKWIEPGALQHADHLTAVSKGTCELILNRYPDLKQLPTTEIPIGCATSDFDKLAQLHRPCPWIDDYSRSIRIAYVGNAWTQSHGTLRAVFAALAQSSDSLAASVRMIFVGSSNLVLDDVAPVVDPIAESMSVSNQVIEHAERVPYLDALNVMRKTDINLIIGSNDSHYTASKVYPLVLAGRPILAVIHRDSSVNQVLAETGGALVVNYDDITPVSDVIDEIQSALEKVIIEFRNMKGPCSSAMTEHLATGISRRFAEVFDSVCAET